MLNENEWVSNPPEPFVTFNVDELQLLLTENEALDCPSKLSVRPPADGFNTAAI